MPLRLKQAAILLFGLGALGIAFGAEAKPCRMRSPDLAVAGVKLLDPESAARVLGSGPQLIEDTEELPHARFVTKSGSQELILYATYGAELDQYSEAEVRTAGKEAMVLNPLEVDTFVTDNGIELGMSTAEVLRRLGKCAKIAEKRGTSEFVSYDVTDAEKDPKLKVFGYPAYYAEYEFEDGRLVRFRFGFESP
jgi:hypothetical protein